MNDNERKKWLEELKMGDQVAVDYASFSRRPSWRILTVKSFTRTRNRFDLVEPGSDRVQSVGKDGYFPRTSVWRQVGIHPVTPQVLADIEWTQTSYKLSALETKMQRRGMDGLTLEQMKRLIAAYEEVLGGEAENQD